MRCDKSAVLTARPRAVASWMGDNRIYGAPSEVSFLLFCSIWTLIAIAFLLVVSVKFASTIASHAYALLAVEAVTMLFWFAGFIALAVYIGGVSETFRLSVLIAGLTINVNRKSAMDRCVLRPKRASLSAHSAGKFPPSRCL